MARRVHRSPMIAKSRLSATQATTSATTAIQRSSGRSGAIAGRARPTGARGRGAAAGFSFGANLLAERGAVLLGQLLVKAFG